jgi:hypothetical protein
MKLMRSICLAAGALALVASTAQEASAQAPAPTWQQLSPTRIRVDWQAVPGATYEVFVTNLGIGPIPVPTNFFVVDPPPGVYVVQVRIAGTSIVSSPVTINFGGGPPPGCTAPEAPTLTVSATGVTVNASWTAVAGAIGYELQVSNAPGGAALARVQLPAGQTAYATSGPIGTYYARVVAGSACGAVSTSGEQSFTLGAATPGPSPNPGGGTGAGPRTPNPTATNGGVPCVPGRLDLGYCIPIQSLGYASGVVNAVAAANPFDVHNSCREEGGNMLFIHKAVQALRRIDTRWGMNLKRGNQGVSEDIIAFNPTDRPDNGESQIYLFDAIGGHCGPNPVVSGLGDVTMSTWNAGLANTPGCSTRFCAAWTLSGYPFQP